MKKCIIAIVISLTITGCITSGHVTNRKILKPGEEISIQHNSPMRRNSTWDW